MSSSYEHVAEDSVNVDPSPATERNRTAASRAADRYVKRIKYGNIPSSCAFNRTCPQLSWLFEVVFDYGEGHSSENPPDDAEDVFSRQLPSRRPSPGRFGRIHFHAIAHASRYEPTGSASAC